MPSYAPGRTVPGTIKLASNESPHGPLPFVVERVAEIAAAANRYPDILSVAVGEALAAKYGTTPDHVVVGCGSASICQQLIAATCDQGDEVLYGWRSFEAYPIMASIMGATSVQVPLTPSGAYDLDAMAAAITERTRIVFVCNPNNPTGVAVDGATLERFLDRVPSTVLVALDEAYHEYVDDPAVSDGMQLLSRYPNLIAVRTFSKAYGLAGLRIGYGVAADPAVVNAARQVQAPFAVTQVAQGAALASLEPQAMEQLAARVAEVQQERVRVRDELLALGYPVPTTQANFVWLPEGPRDSGGIDPAEFAKHCEAGGVIVRPFAGWGVRVTISTPAENDVFLAAARTALG
jgi:histidinol-phosphate aminotransferase